MDITVAGSTSSIPQMEECSGSASSLFDLHSVHLKQMNGHPAHAVQPFVAFSALEVLPCATHMSSYYARSFPDGPPPYSPNSLISLPTMQACIND